MCDIDHFAESVAEYEARGLVTRRQFGVLLAAGVAMMLPEHRQRAGDQRTGGRDQDAGRHRVTPISCIRRPAPGRPC